MVNDGKVNSAPSQSRFDNAEHAACGQCRAEPDPSLSAPWFNWMVLVLTDVDGDPLTYQWSLIWLAPGSTAILEQPDRG